MHELVVVKPRQNLGEVRRKEGRDEEPSAAVIDSQSIKTSAVRGPEKGFDMGKRIWGRKRHLLVNLIIIPLLHTFGDKMSSKHDASASQRRE